MFLYKVLKALKVGYHIYININFISSNAIIFGKGKKKSLLRCRKKKLIIKLMRMILKEI